jgi:hypothetical protein
MGLVHAQRGLVASLADDILPGLHAQEQLVTLAASLARARGTLQRHGGGSKGLKLEMAASV